MDKQSLGSKDPKKILAHLKSVDPIITPYAEKIGISKLEHRRVNKESDKKSYYFISLSSSIIGQQLSGKVADVIFARFVKLFPKEKVTPEHTLKLDTEKIRMIGISYSKISYLKDLAQKFLDGEIKYDKFDKLPNGKIAEELIKVKGIGPWTAEMFLLFTLGKEDIFSHGDLGLKRAIEKIYKIDNPTKEDVEKITIKWSPYRSYVSLILWKSLDIKY